MINNNIQITVITLTKNDSLKFERTLKSLILQDINFMIEWIVIDGSRKKEISLNKSLIKKTMGSGKYKNLLIHYVNSKILNINGIYPCMNYGKSIAKGKFIFFLNSGDELYNRNSLKTLFNYSKKVVAKSSLIFGQAYIISEENICWNFPGNKLKNIKFWLKLFEPNHQTMLISKNLCNKFNFEEKYNLIADGYWKREILKNASEIIYIKKPISKFFLDGISSSKPSKELMISILRNKKINLLRKLIFFVKFITPKKLFSFYIILQKYKSMFFDLLL